MPDSPTNSQDPPWDTPEDAGKPASRAYERKIAESMAELDGTVSHEPTERERTLTDTDGQSLPSLTTPDQPQEVGNVTAQQGTEPSAGVEATRVASLIGEVTGRFMREKRWFGDEGLSKTRDDMLRLARAQKMPKLQAQAWVYSELDRLYPPEKCTDSTSVDKQGQFPSVKAGGELNNLSPIGDKTRSDDGSIQGLSSIPQDWPELPANASMSAEIGWVQANRLRIVTEQPGKATRVDLGKALSPAPSWAALGWLETSIRSYAKFVDVAARASGADDGEQGVMKRERMSIEEVRSLLSEMIDQAER